jgi:hypothetical protein
VSAAAADARYCSREWIAQPRELLVDDSSDVERLAARVGSAKHTALRLLCIPVGRDRSRDPIDDQFGFPVEILKRLQ